MNSTHSTASSAVVTRLHDVARSTEKSGAVNGRGCVRGAGRPYRPPYIAVVETAPKPAGRTRAGRPVGRRPVVSRPGGGTRARRTGRSRGSAPYGRRPRTPRRRSPPTSRSAGSLYATAYHLTGDRFEAEDLLQSALFSTYRAWDRISDKAAVGGYLRRTMTNLHISAWRRRKLNEYPTEELPETAGDTDAMRGTELRTVLWQALSRLPETQRTMLVLRYYEGRTDPEIADILNISVGTVKSSIWRSLRRLREDEVLSFGRDEEESFGELVA